ncbi:unnamed protein product [Effrenium voratum]|nr:unnamed protein product [Effrenium voratum]
MSVMPMAAWSIGQVWANGQVSPSSPRLLPSGMVNGAAGKVARAASSSEGMRSPINMGMHRPVAVASASFSPVSFANLPNAPQAAVCHARAPTAGPEEARGSSSVSLPVKLLRWDSAGAGSLSTQEPSASSSQLAVGGSIAASAANSVGDAQVGALRCEIEGLRAELDALKSLLDEGAIRMRSSVCRRQLGL